MSKVEDTERAPDLTKQEKRVTILRFFDRNIERARAVILEQEKYIKQQQKEKNDYLDKQTEEINT